MIKYVDIFSNIIISATSRQGVCNKASSNFQQIQSSVIFVCGKKNQLNASFLLWIFSITMKQFCVQSRFHQLTREGSNEGSFMD